MNFNIFDAPPIRSILFYPRSAQPLKHPKADIVDGTIPVEENVVLGYRLYINRQDEAPLLLFFHGNGEIAADYNQISTLFLNLGLSMLVVDFRGYGWSTGEPRVKYLISDAVPVIEALADLRANHDLSTTSPLYVMGRSLGSVSAIEATHAHPELVSGLIIESGFAQLPPVLARLGIPVQWQANLPDPIGNLRKMTDIEVPLLIIHGENDSLIPPANGQKLYDASPASIKLIERIQGVGHNNLLVKRDIYFNAIREFLKKAAATPS